MSPGARLLSLRCDGAILAASRATLRRWDRFRWLLSRVDREDVDTFLSIGEAMRVVVLRLLRDRLAAMVSPGYTDDVADLAPIADCLKRLIGGLDELLDGRMECLPYFDELQLAAADRAQGDS